MASYSFNKSELCEQCASWDFDHLFKGDVDNAHLVGPLRDEGSKRTWDRRTLDAVRRNVDCRLCQFIYQLVITSSAWTEASEDGRKSSNAFILNYQKEEFCSLLPSDQSYGGKEKITTLALELQDTWNRQESSPTLSYLNYPHLQCYQFRGDQNGQQSQQMLAVRRLKTQIDFELVQQWVKSCNAHGQACMKQTSFERKPAALRLIDIKGRSLVWKTMAKDYAALSYMWGPPSLGQARLTQTTRAGLFLEGALAEENDTIPRTIRDAIVVCERLAIPYLWVDALCIEQDSSDLNVHLHMMNDIYAAAYLTIVAACGADSWSGLSGMMPDSRKVHQPSILIDNMEIGLAVPEFWTSVMHSSWASRGWTFQERLFSRRMLIFAESQCFFYCDKMSRFESTITELEEGGKDITHRFLYPHLWVDDRDKLFNLKTRLFSIYEDEHTLINYFQLFRNHRRLTLTYQEDVLRAFGGVITTYERHMSSEFHFGMPLSMFTWAVLLDCTQSTRRPNFPSWSWAGWSTDREEYKYPGWTVSESSKTVLFYRLHPTLNARDKQEEWSLQAIDDVHVPKSAGSRRAIDVALRGHVDQPLPAHLDRQDLEKLLIFDALTSRLEVSPQNLSSFRDSKYMPDPNGAIFDQDHNMTFAGLRVMGSSESTTELFPAYLSRHIFPKDMLGNPIPTILECVLIAKGNNQYGRVVWLMVVDMDDNGISTRLSFCILLEIYWLESNPQTRRVHLM